MGRALKRVSPEAESVCFSEVVTLLEVASPVTADFGDAGAAFEVAGRALKRVSVEPEGVSLSEPPALRGAVSGVRTVTVEESGRLAKRGSLEPGSAFPTGGGTSRRDAPSLAVDVTAALVIVAEEAARALKRVLPESASAFFSGIGGTFRRLEADALRGAALGVGAGAAPFCGVGVPSFNFT